MLEKIQESFKIRGYEDGFRIYFLQDEKPTLSQVNFTLSSAQTVAVIGQVGCGKVS